MRARILDPRRFRDRHIRFPDHDRANSEVRIYYLTPEELEKYRSLPKPTGKEPIVHVWDQRRHKMRVEDYMDEVCPEEFKKEDYLRLKDLGFSDRKIWQFLGKNIHWFNQKKREWGLLGYRVRR